MHQTIPANEWVLAFIESERAELQRRIPLHEDAHESFPAHQLRPANYSLVEKFVTGAVALIRDCCHRPATAGPKCMIIADDRIGYTANSADEASAGTRDTETADLIPAEDIASIRILERASGALDEDTPHAEDFLLTTAILRAASILHASSLLVRRAASLLRAAFLLAAEVHRAASLLRAIDCPCFDNNSLAARAEGCAAGRLATGNRTLLRTCRRGGDAGL
jgi:hypothetical protein